MVPPSAGKVPEVPGSEESNGPESCTLWSTFTLRLLFLFVCAPQRTEPVPVSSQVSSWESSVEFKPLPVAIETKTSCEALHSDISHHLPSLELTAVRTTIYFHVSSRGLKQECATLQP